MHFLRRAAARQNPIAIAPVLPALLLLAAGALHDGVARAQATPPLFTLQARVIAVGLPGAHGLRQVGRFHAGGPFTANPEFLLQTQAGRVLDSERVLVTVEGNLGAPPGNATQRPGTVLSIDTQAVPAGVPLRIAADLALRPTLPGAAVQIYSAQSGRYMNRQHNTGARTAAFAAVAGPRYLSINNAFGRPWIANAPFGLKGAGSESVVDPDGAPLANAPSDVAGGVFAGSDTPRTSVPKSVRSGWFASLWNRHDSAQLTAGELGHGAFGTALLGTSPDGSGFAVFAVVTGDGAVVQVHVQDGVDGIAPPGTIAVGGVDPGVIGMAFKWNPNRALFVVDARRNRIVTLGLADDQRHFTLAHLGAIDSPWLNAPIDLAPTLPEIANPRFASLTTLAGGSDLYVANRGDGSLLRLRQDGSAVARAQIVLPDGRRLGAGSLRALAVSSDGQRVWVIAQAVGSDACDLLEVNAFDAAGPLMQLESATPGVSDGRSASTAQDGARLFATTFTAATGLGAVFNATSCMACHPDGSGASTREEHFARRVARIDTRTGRVLPLEGQSSLIAPRLRAGMSAPGTAPLPRGANVVSLRMPLALAAAAHIDEIDDATIEAQAVSKGDGIAGHVQRVPMPDGTSRVGRYGWKADIVTLDTMVADAFGNELGLASALASHPHAPYFDDGAAVRSVAQFVRLHVATPSTSRHEETAK